MTATNGSGSDVTEIVYSEVPGNVGHLLQVAVELVCPACQQQIVSKVKREAVTLWQKFVCSVNVLLCCKPIRWNGRHDINHYCSNCGCFIGRHIVLSWYKRSLFRKQRAEVEENESWQRLRIMRKTQAVQLNKQGAIYQINA